MMLISEGLQVQKALSQEIAQRREMAKEKAYKYVNDPGAAWVPQFDLEANEGAIRRLTRLHAKIGQAIAKTNLTVHLAGVTDADYSEWF